MTQATTQLPLAQQRCFNHSHREAAARCPMCRRFFCRECVTEHAGKVICAACLKKLAEPATRARWNALELVRYALAVVALAVAWLFFMCMGQLLLTLPSSFHAGTMWGK